MYSADSPGTVCAATEYTYFDVVDNDGLDLVETNLPVLAGVETRVAIQRRPRKSTPGVETGRPETSREFAARMKDHFVVKGPRQRKEGRNGNGNVNKTTPKPAPTEKLTIRLPPLAKNNVAPKSDDVKTAEI